MWLEMLKCWVMIVIAAVIVGLSVSSCVTAWMPCCNMGWLKWGVWLMCAIFGVAYIVKYALIIKRLAESRKEE